MKKVSLRFSIEVPDDTDPARVVEVANEALDDSACGGTLVQWGNWDYSPAELADVEAGDVWIVLIEHQDGDADPLPVSSEERAIEYARSRARHDGVTPEELPPVMCTPGLVLLIPHSEEGGRIRVVKRTMDGER